MNCLKFNTAKNAKLKETMREKKIKIDSRIDKVLEWHDFTNNECKTNKKSNEWTKKQKSQKCGECESIHLELCCQKTR